MPQHACRPGGYRRAVSKPRLIPVAEPDDPDGVVVLVHGGGARRRGQMMVSPTQLSVLRMVPIARRIARAGRGRLAVYRLLNSYRGWDTTHTPVHDVRWALDQVRERYVDSPPVCLVGHSLGGRAAILAAPSPGVRSVVALAPYVYPADAQGLDLRDRTLLVVHGLRDRIASPRNSALLVDSLPHDVRVGYVAIKDGKHAMLSHHRDFDRTASQFALATLLGRRVTSPVADVLNGSPWVEV